MRTEAVEKLLSSYDFVFSVWSCSRSCQNVAVCALLLYSVCHSLGAGISYMFLGMYLPFCNPCVAHGGVQSVFSPCVGRGCCCYWSVGISISSGTSIGLVWNQKVVKALYQLPLALFFLFSKQRKVEEKSCFQERT